MLRKNCVQILFRLFALIAFPFAAYGEAQPLFSGARAPLIAPPQQTLLQAPTAPVRPMGASLFQGRANGGLFAPVERGAGLTEDLSRGALALSAHDVQVIRNVIGRAESHRDGYDAVQHGAKRRPPKPPTQMTLGEIFEWIKATPGQPHAIGRYQFIPKTLGRLVTILDLGPEARFTPALQDRLSDILLAEAGLHDLRAGEMSRKQFMNNLAQIWAGLPTSSGKSHYHGYAGNRASITWAEFDRELARVFPG